ncbi:hypothetical protein JJD26997_1276 [Campylobacter jejuni subsp. doylei 269.97]|uniref:Uncharacterized protein n=1 Tax=Campylobacter jejuni subsp. doylei (strain ATCC BAA-1458 / RM4099 / 269.97) TaxID=360109 RepID=A7H497_CAMJD|nr:hypothetical protein JJD26997_1276 [Campylobacter jejuni subsp. doylei 269.97]
MGLKNGGGGGNLYKKYIRIAYFKYCKKQSDLIKYKFKISIILKHFISKEENEKNI